MPTITFIHSDGSVQKVEGTHGETILRIALDAGIPLEHACGGNGFCTTCMCDIPEGMMNLSPRNDREENMGVTDDPHRLGCQARVQGDASIQLLDEEG